MIYSYISNYELHLRNIHLNKNFKKNLKCLIKIKYFTKKKLLKLKVTIIVECKYCWFSFFFLAEIMHTTLSYWIEVEINSNRI